jgi:hypothetical protein
MDTTEALAIVRARSSRKPTADELARFRHLETLPVLTASEREEHSRLWLQCFNQASKAHHHTALAAVVVVLGACLSTLSLLF